MSESGYHGRTDDVVRCRDGRLYFLAEHFNIGPGWMALRVGEDGVPVRPLEHVGVAYEDIVTRVDVRLSHAPTKEPKE